MFHQSYYQISIVLLLSVLCLGECVPTKSEPDAIKVDRSAFKKSLDKNCDGSYSLTCLKLDLVSLVDRLSENDGMTLLPGVSIVKENNTASTNTADIVADLARSFPDDPEARLDAFVKRKFEGFLSNHALKLNLGGSQADSAFTGRKKDKGGGSNMGMLLGMAAMMKGTLMSAALAGLAALAGKALIASLISLVLSAIAALKGQGGGGGHTTYEVVAKPVYSHSASHSTSYEDGHGGGGWGGGHGRSMDSAALPLALQPGYQLPQ